MHPSMDAFISPRKDRWYQCGNQKPYVEGQYWATRTPPKPEGELVCSGRVKKR